MFKKNLAFLCYGFFILTISSKSQQYYTSNNEEKDHNLTVQYNIETDSTTIYNDEIKTLQYNLYEKFINRPRYGIHDELRIILTNNDLKDVDSILYKLSRRSVHNHEDDNKVPMNSHTNWTNVNHKKNFTSEDVYENIFEKSDFMSNKVFEDFNKYNNESNVIPYEMCHNNTCILLCCPLGYSMRLNDNKCIPQEIKYVFPNVYEYINNSIQNKNKRVDEFFQLAVHDSCLETLRVMVDEGHEHDYKIFTNGSIYLSYYKTLFKSTSYCLGVFLERGNKFEVSFCSEILDEVIKNAMDTPEVRSVFRAFKIYAGSQIVCILFLFAIFLVYSILPELRHVHGFLLRNYSAVATIATIVNIAKVMHFKTEIPYPVCITLAFLEYFFLMSGFFWLSAMSFNIWWTFRSFCSLQENIRQSEKKKLMYYVIFAYGGPFILAIVCVIVIDFVSEYLPINLRPEFKLGNCWYFGERKEAFVLYFYGMKSVCIISTICLFISTVLKVRRYEKDTGFCLTDSKSERYNDYKKWFNLYMKLFIVMFIAMGINWIVLTMSWLFEKLITYYLFYVTALLDVVQSFCIFIIFVWNKKIKLMLLKRFGFKTNVSNIEHLTITSEVSMQEKRSSSAQENYYTKDLSVGIKL